MTVSIYKNTFNVSGKLLNLKYTSDLNLVGVLSTELGETTFIYAKPDASELKILMKTYSLKAQLAPGLDLVLSAPFADFNVNLQVLGELFYLPDNKIAVFAHSLSIVGTEKQQITVSGELISLNYSENIWYGTIRQTIGVEHTYYHFCVENPAAEIVKRWTALYFDDEQHDLFTANNDYLLVLKGVFSKKWADNWYIDVKSINLRKVV